MNSHGQETKPQPNKYSPQFKEQALERAKKDGVGTAARDLGLVPAMLYSWQAKARQTGQPFEEQKLQQAEMTRLKRENARLAEAVAFLKNAAAYFARSPSEEDIRHILCLSVYGLNIHIFGQAPGCCMSDHVVSDRFWAQAEPLLEPFKRRKSGGSKPLDFRQVMNGILYVLKSGCQWSLLPRCYGSKSAVHEHFQRWMAGGVFTALFRLGADTYEELCGFEWTWPSMDGSLVQAPVRQARCQAAEGLGRNPTDRGRSGSKLHLQVDQNGLPVALMLAGAHVHDSRLITPTVQAGVIQSPATAAHPRHLCLDKGYDYARVELEVVDWGYTPHIRRIGEEMTGGTGATEETHPARRWVVERTFA